MTKEPSHLERLRDPALRGLVIAASAALAVIFVVLFDSGSVAAAGVPVLCGVAGLLLRWTAMPIALVFTLGYFLLFPVGIPFGNPYYGYDNLTHFRIHDLTLAAALLVYLSAQFRLFALTTPRGHEASERPVRTFNPRELTREVLPLATIVLVGQGIWYFVETCELHFGTDAPLRVFPSDAMRLGAIATPSTQTVELNRFLLCAIIFIVVAAFARFCFWYFRLRSLSPVEAKQILIDTEWQGNRRELARLETWRARVLGNSPAPAKSDALFRGIVRGIVLVNFACFLVWILYIYFSFR